MIKVIWDRGFKRSYKRKVKNNDEYKKKFWDALELFVKKDEILLIDIGSHDEVY